MEDVKKQKLTYEQLEGIAHQLSDQVRKLSTQVREMNVSNVMARLDLLFRVVNHKDSFKESFVQMCIDEIEELMTIPEEETNQTEENQTEKSEQK